MSPRILVIAYDFPPHGAIGTMRTLRLVRQLDREGWDITVLTGSPATFRPGTPVEPKLEAQVPSGVRVLRAPALRGVDALTRKLTQLRPSPDRPAAVDPQPTTAGPKSNGKRSLLRRTKDWVDAALSIPDNESGWIAPATALGLRHMTSGRPDVIYSSAPPWSGHVVALALAQYARRPWVADFRDPWARAPWREWHKLRHRGVVALERRVIGRADAVLFVTRANLDEFSRFYGQTTSQRFHLIPNGCDPSEFEDVMPLPSREEFVLLHAGTFYGERNPMPVIAAIARAVNRGALDRTRFRLRLLGQISLTMDLPSECRRLGIEDVVEFVPRVTRGESIRELKSASALLLVQAGTVVSVPGKAYEYLAAGRPVLALSEEGETAELVRASGIGRSVPPAASVEAVEAALLDVVALASKPYALPPRELYDGRTHAETTARALLQFAGHGRQHVIPDSQRPMTIPKSATAIEETRR